jgi:hypothetical protein
MIEYSLVQFVSSRYREARSTVENHFRVLLSSVDMHPELNTARAIWMHHCVFSCASSMLGLRLSNAAAVSRLVSGSDPGLRKCARSGALHILERSAAR